MTSTAEKFALVIPTLNEAANIEPALARAVAGLSEVTTPWEILVVDDISEDETCGIVRRFSASEPRVHLLPPRGRRGLAGAITYGWANTTADLIGVMDADLQHPPELLPILVQQLLKGADVVIASRYLRPDSMADWSASRRIISRAGVLASKPVQRPNLKVADPLSGFFVLRRRCIEGIAFQTTGFKLLLEILARGRVKTVVEVPFKFAVRHGGASKANAMTAVHYFSLLCRLLVGR